jgi:hypothetical protein
LANNTSGSFNTAFGTNALFGNTTASNNTAVGYQAGYSNTTGTGNVYVGEQAGYSTTSSYNTLVGEAAGNTVTSGQKNTFVGNNSGGGMTTGSNNTIIGTFDGNYGGLDIRTSSNNIVLSDGSRNPRVWVNSSGNLLVGSTYDGFNSRQTNYFSGTGAEQIGLSLHTGGGSGVIFEQFVNSSGSRIGSVSQSGTSAVAYNTSSDYRLKENVVELTGATARLNQLNPSRFNFIADPDTTVDGFLAHEVQAIVPEAITGTKDEVDADGNPVYQGIDQSKLVPLLVATIKELEARITALENA